jgi:hypothetical protein
MPTEIIISDMSGKTYDCSNGFSIIGNNSIEINVENLNSGVYILNIKLPDGNQKTYRFIKE